MYFVGVPVFLFASLSNYKSVCFYAGKSESEPKMDDRHFVLLLQDPNCPGTYVTKDTPPLKLGVWLNTQRQARKGKSKISASRVTRLEELGVWWNRNGKGEIPQNSVDE
mgnify:CR=1 FL=1